MSTEQSKEQILLSYLDTTAPVFIAIVEPDGRVVETNRFVRELTGRSTPPEALTEVIVDFSGGLNLPELAKEPEQTHLFHVSTFSGLPQTFYFQFVRWGERIVVLGKTDTVEAEGWRHALVLLNNELNNLTRELQKKNAELATLNELKNQLLGMASHDLRKPASAVMSYSEILLAGVAGELTPRQQQFLEQIRSSSELMKAVLEDFLDLAVIESGRLKLERLPTDLPMLIKRSIAENRPLAWQRHIEIDLRCAEPLLPVRLDPTMIQQALNNLLCNALEHSPPEGKVEIQVTQSETEVAVAVENHGPGIPPDEVPKLFQPFGRARVRKSSGERSTGLGLVIAQKIVEAHHGHLSVEGRPDGKTVFRFALPRELA